MVWHALATYQSGKDRRAALVLQGGRVFDLAAAADATQTMAAPLATGSVDGLLEAWPTAHRAVAVLADAASGAAASGKLQPVAGAEQKLLAPHTPRRLFCAASNYVEHANEMGTKLAGKVNSRPYMFMKPDTSVVGPDSTVVIPPRCTKLDWEVELGAVIGVEARHVPVDRALDVVAGYTVVNDISARDLNVRSDFPFKFDWFQGKCFDTFAPIGPWIVPSGCIGDPQRVKLSLKVSGATMQDADTTGMIFTVAEQIAYLSQILTLKPGDVIATGTPTGVGAGRGIFLKDGDVMEAAVEHIGTLRNPVAAQA